MQIEPLNLTHQTLLEERFRKLNLSLSEYSFANLYLFRSLHRYQVIHLENEIFIKGLTRDKTAFIMLTTSPENISDVFLLQILSLAEIIYPLPDHWVEILKFKLEKLGFVLADSSYDKGLNSQQKIEGKPNTYNLFYRDEESDYIYRLNDLATYPGRHFDGKRNLVKQLLNHHQAESQSINTQMKDCEIILNNWQKGHGDTPEETDYLSCLEALNHFNQLRLNGTIVYVDGEPSGFTLGEPISNNCYVIHFSKAVLEIRGIYQYLIEESAQALEKTCEWINLEQDLGLATLKDSKLSYHPTFLLKKWYLQSFLKDS